MPFNNEKNNLNEYLGMLIFSIKIYILMVKKLFINNVIFV